MIAFWPLLSNAQSYQQQFNSAVDLLDSNIYGAVQEFEIIRTDSIVPEVIRLNSSIILANICVNQGDINGLRTYKEDIQAYVNLHPEDSTTVDVLERFNYYEYELIQQSASFGERICGLWVSAESDFEGLPWFMMSIGHDEKGFWSALHTQSVISDYVRASSYTIISTYNIDINSSSSSIGLHFGRSWEKEARTNLAQSLTASAMQGERDAANYKARTGNYDIGTSLADIILLGIARNAAVAKTTYQLLDVELKELCPDIMKGYLYFQILVDRSDNVEDADNLKIMREIYLYRITPSDSIVFKSRRYQKEVPYISHLIDAKGFLGNYPSIDSHDVADQLAFATANSKKGKIDINRFNYFAYNALRAKIYKHLSEIKEDDDVDWVFYDLKYGPLGLGWTDGSFLYSFNLDSIEYDVTGDHNNYIIPHYEYREDFRGPYNRIGLTTPWFSKAEWLDSKIYLVSYRCYWMSFKRTPNGLLHERDFFPKETEKIFNKFKFATDKLIEKRKNKAGAYELEEL